ncbi:hypothetical protein L3X38_001791 [Prunus dulcis]|uniref:Retrovirus-related Pol polyprotein from transposon TNT 1-94-like beta-barrel domain-containing protein n=1 Tax=Prunus dulcis TaxID=3755 RepID=A0AAD4WU85_PRUDU|nr:hypothetical protein L3X38_001791 [Prunus dulcis]
MQSILLTRFTLTRASITTIKGSVFHTSFQKSKWIINLGAMDHMAFDLGQLISGKSSNSSVVSNANGTLSFVVREGSLSLSTSLYLDSVLIVPSFDHNLLSATQLTTTLEYTITFWPNHCVFQNILTGKTIGCGIQRDKLYYLDWASDSETKVSQAFTTSGTHFEEERDKVWCDTCELAKSHHVPFPLSSNKSLVLFSLVHSDVWGPAKIATPDITLLQNNQLPLLSSSNTENLLQSDQLPEENDQLSPSCQIQDEKIEPFYVILPTPENSSTLVPYQLPIEEVIQVTSFLETDNTNEISHDDLISEGTEPTYQLPERKNRGKPRVPNKADLKPKEKYPINNYISLSRLSEACVYFVKQLADISIPNSVAEALEDLKWKEAMNKEMRALQKNVTWELVPLPHGKKTVGRR